MTDTRRPSDLTQFLLYVLVHAAAIGLIALGTYLVLLFWQPEWHLAQYIALAAIFLLVISVATLWQRLRRRRRL